MAESVLIVDDDDGIRMQLESYFEARGKNVTMAANGRTAIELTGKKNVDVALVDLRLPDMSGLRVLEAIKKSQPEASVIIITAFGSVETAVQAMQMQADNFLLKPIQLDVLDKMIDKILNSRECVIDATYLKEKVSLLEGRGISPRHPQELMETINILAGNSSTLALILGETGTGKGMMAREIHDLSDRKNHRFVDINCAAIGDQLLESELFGYEKGAFTDAKQSKRGLFEVAHKGSILLDEIAELSASAQAKLLKVIETKTFRRIGGTAEIKVDTRVMAATNADLAKLAEKNKFRKDLFFRLNVIPIHMPPLRERTNDIIPLAKDFIEGFNKQFGKQIRGLSIEAENLLLSYPWPGNIREMKNMLERAVLLCKEDEIQTTDLPDDLSPSKAAPYRSSEMSLEEVERKHIAAVFEECGQNLSKSSRILGISRSTLRGKLRKYGLDPNDG